MFVRVKNTSGENSRELRELRQLIRAIRLIGGLLLFPGAILAQPIQLRVDASEAPRRIYHAQLTIPAAPGPLTLAYPKWIPGEHAPTGPITDLAGLTFSY